MQSMKDIEALFDKVTSNYRPLLNGERYLSDVEVSHRLKLSRRTLQKEWNEVNRSKEDFIQENAFLFQHLLRNFIGFFSPLPEEVREVFSCNCDMSGSQRCRCIST